MHDQPTDRPRELRPGRSGLLVLSGYGLKIRVERRHLAVEDGVGRDRGVGRIHKTARLQRLVVLGQSDGYVTLDALRWLRDGGAAFVCIDADGTLVATGSDIEVNDVRLRRAQAFAAVNGLGLQLSRELLRAKLREQRSVLEAQGSLDHERVRTDGRRYEATTRAVIARSLQGFDAARDLEGMRYLESRAADAYWAALASTPVRFPQKDAPRIPEHWRTLGPRTSPLTRGPRLAATPAHAMLNYLYAIVEAEATIAARALGLDPEMAFLHADKRFRDSLAHDLMEPLRPVVDRWVLELLAERVLSSGDFIETREGACRLAPGLARSLVRDSPKWGRPVRIIVQWLGRILQSAAASDGAATHYAETALPPLGPMRTEGVPLPPRRCEICGTTDLGRQGQRFCARCLKSDELERIPRMVAASVRARVTPRAGPGSDADGRGQEAPRVRLLGPDVAYRPDASQQGADRRGCPGVPGAHRPAHPERRPRRADEGDRPVQSAVLANAEGFEDAAHGPLEGDRGPRPKLPPDRAPLVVRGSLRVAVGERRGRGAVRGRGRGRPSRRRWLTTSTRYGRMAAWSGAPWQGVRSTRYHALALRDG